MPLRSLHAYSVRVAVCTVTLFGQETRQFMSETLSQLGPFSRRTVTEDLLNSVNTFTLYCDLITIELKEVQQKSLNHALKENKLIRNNTQTAVTNMTKNRMLENKII